MTTAAPHAPATHHAPAAHAGHGAADGHDHGVGHLVPPRILILTSLALLVLTFITVAVTWFDLGEFNIYIALTIAVIKGALVALFFMHLRWDRPFNSIVFVISLALVALFIGFALTDTAEYQPEILPQEGAQVQAKLTELTGEVEKHQPAHPVPPAGDYVPHEGGGQDH